MSKKRAQKRKNSSIKKHQRKTAKLKRASPIKKHISKPKQNIFNEHIENKKVETRNISTLIKFEQKYSPEKKIKEIL